MNLSIGDVRISLESEAPKISLDDRSKLFLMDSVRSAINLSVRAGHLPPERNNDQIFATEYWSLSRTHQEEVFRFYAPALRSAPYRSLRLDPKWSRGEIVLDASHYAGFEEVDPLQFPLAELLVIGKIARSGGVVLHACGVLDEKGRGILFPGRSGDGKTTTAKLWASQPGATVLSDDRIVLRRSETGFRIYGTPWHGEGQFCSNLDAPLAGVFFLEHGEGNAAIPMPESETVSMVMARCFPPFYDREGVDAILESLSILAGSVPCFKFPFIPNQDALEFVERIVEKGSP